jgi:hypothetical protein
MTKLTKRTKLELFIELLKDPDRKSLFQIISEFLNLLLIHREFPTHYFSRYLFKKRTTNIKDYLPNKLLDEKIPSILNDKKVKEVLDNKLYFDLYYSQFNISLPKIVMYNHKEIFIVGNKLIKVHNASDLTFLLEEIFKQNSSYDSIMIKKTYASSSGNQIYKLFLHQLRTDPEKVNEIYSEVTRSEFLFQETVRQHPELDKLNASCLNTIRIDTFIGADRKIDIISAHIRMSTSNYHVDNINSGGCAVGIDLQTSKLKKYGYSDIHAVGVKVLTEHPITKTVFENFSIPFFPQVKELALKTASFMPGLRLIGWDVAIGESGPVLIEGNSNYEISGSDFLNGGYLANTTFRKVLHEINYL